MTLAPGFIAPVKGEPGAQFVAERLHAVPEMPYPDPEIKSRDDYRQWLAKLWRQAVDAKRVQTARLMRMEKLYSGFHYKDPRENRLKEVTNYCFSAVESQWSTVTQRRPRPKVKARNPARADKAADVDAFCDWLMDQGNFDASNEITQRIKFKMGWNVWHVIAGKDGKPQVRWINDFHFYRDPNATDDLATDEYVCVAFPVATRKLRRLFPDVRNDKGEKVEIKADNLMGPEVEVYREMYEKFYADDIGSMRSNQDLVTRLGYLGGNPADTNNTTPTGTQWVLDSPGGGIHRGADTTFVVQFFIRDDTTRPCTWEGHKLIPHPAEPGATLAVHGQYMDTKEPCCPSGWRVVQMCADGTFLDEAPLDPCFDGLPFVLGRRFATEGDPYSKGEIDNVASLNQFINKRKHELMQGLGYESNPIFKVTKGSGEAFDKSSITHGEVLKLSRGSDVEQLRVNAPSEQQFAMLATERADFQMIQGSEDASLGKRPTGIQAAAAIRELKAGASVRLEGHMPAYLREMGAVLHKMVCVASRKMDAQQSFLAADGRRVDIDIAGLIDDYEMKFDEGSALQSWRQQQKDELFAYAQAGMIDQQAFLEGIEFPGWPEIVERVRMVQMQQMALEAKAKADRLGQLQDSGGK